MGNRIATIAFVLGLLAVGMAAFQSNFVQETKRPLKQLAADAARTRGVCVAIIFDAGRRAASSTPVQFSDAPCVEGDDH